MYHWSVHPHDDSFHPTGHMSKWIDVGILQQCGLNICLHVGTYERQDSLMYNVVCYGRKYKLFYPITIVALVSSAGIVRYAWIYLF